jgi:NAD(P)-dependent dehydrogenase (short-subunit alcohol dehydrogenase family)
MASISRRPAPQWRVLLGAVFCGIKYAVEPMRKSGGGSIISTSSVAVQKNWLD